ncbi:MAG: glyceraldehyde 3-phosphate dehydrogenase NAD-binding domain-containing protein [Chitinophagaceae bacterium]
MRIAINGMGRIGRLLFRRLLDEAAYEIVAVNDIMDTANLLYLLKYDSLYGPMQHKITMENDWFIVGTKKIKALQVAEPSQMNWKEMNIDIVIECSGKFSNKVAASKHLVAGAKRVLLSTTGSPDIPLMIYGFNHHRLTEETTVISPGGCMTNCATHILYILNSIGIKAAQLNILHSYTSRQELVDTAHSQFRRGRAAAESMIPVEIDLAQSLERLLPPLKDKITAMSIRVPVTNGALADITVQLAEPKSKQEINHLFKTAAEQEYKGILAYTEDPIVSADIKSNTNSCIIDGTLTAVSGSMVKIIAWFDNEYGYTSRILDWLSYISN